MAYDVEAIRAALAQYGQPEGPSMAAPVGVDPQQAANMAAQSYGVMNNIMNRVANPSQIGQSPMFTAPTQSVLAPRSSGSIPMPPPAPAYQGTLPQGFDQGKAVESLGLMGNLSQQQGPTIDDIMKLLDQLRAQNAGPSGGSGGPGGRSWDDVHGTGVGSINPSWGGVGPGGLGFTPTVSGANPYGIETVGGQNFAVNTGVPGLGNLGFSAPDLSGINIAGLNFGGDVSGGIGRNSWGDRDPTGSSRGPGRGVGGR